MEEQKKVNITLNTLVKLVEEIRNRKGCIITQESILEEVAQVIGVGGNEYGGSEGSIWDRECNWQSKCKR